MEDIQSLNSENHQTGTIAKKQLINVQKTKIPLKDSINNNKTKDSDKHTLKKKVFGAEKQIQGFDENEEVECFQAAKNGLCHCNGHNRKSIGSNFYDLTPTPEFLNFLDVTSNPSKMLHLMMNDPNYGALFNEKDPMEELKEPTELIPRSKSPAAYFEEDSHDLDITPLPSEDVDMPIPEEKQNPVKTED
ncbi:uncharacterized protein [Chironomus tepperi]|uniref:uncharacterized protein n=1 Tax=Chironomus tepperi TaxID=113505 RepID=UPI00391F82D5